MARLEAGTSRGLSISDRFLTQDEIDISCGVAERRRGLRAFGTCSKWKSCAKREYIKAVAEGVNEVCKGLKQIKVLSLNECESFPQVCKKRIPRDPRLPLFDDPHPIYESINLVEWLTYLPMFCQQCLAGPSFDRNYRREDSIWMADKCVWVLEMISNELQGVKVYEAHRKVVGGKPNELSEEEVARIRRHLWAAVDEWHDLGVEPAKIAEELMAIIWYTTELKTAGEESIARDVEIHGKNPSLYGVMNWSVRVFKDLGKKWDDEQMNACEKAIQLFLPILARIDVFLSRLPADHTTLYRGDRAQVSAGIPSPWTTLDYLTEDFNTAFESGNVVFIANGFHASAVDFATVYPEEAVHLMPTYSWVKVVNVISPTLLRILGLTCGYITVRSAGDELTSDQHIERLTRKEESHVPIFEKFVSRYVEASVYHAPPPLPYYAKPRSMFEVIQKFLVSESPKHMLLLGSEGCGKSSALLAVYCELLRQTRKIRGKIVVPIFIPLASLEVSVDGAEVLDRALLNYLGVSPLEFSPISSQCELVVLLDSLDECGDHVKTWFPLLDATQYCHKARVIVSCRTGFLSDIVSPSLAISKGCSVLYIQQFTRDQVEVFLEKASKGMAIPVTVNHMASLGISDDMLDSPVTLTMGMAVVQKRRQYRGLANSVPLLDFECPEKTRVGLYSAYLHTCRFRSKRVLQDTKVADFVDVFDSENTASLRRALQDVAITMLARGEWKLALSEVRNLFEKYFGNSRDAVNNALNHAPIRLESLDDYDGEFSFWHKSIGEFLCASALWGNESKRYLEMTGQGKCTPFSMREPGVLSFFNEISTSMERRQEVCCGILLGTLIESRGVNRHEVVASNAMALLAISQFPLQGADLRNLVIKDCLAYEGNFRSAVLDGTCFEDCDLNRSDFQGASLKGTGFTRCTFGPLKQAPLKGHTDVVRSLCWSPDGKLVASGSWDKSIRVWEVATGREVKKLEGHTNSVLSVCWSPDGKLIASGSSDSSIRIWEDASGREVKKLEGHAGIVWSVCWSPDGKLVASGSSDKSIRMWEVASGREVKKLEGHTAYVRSVCWSPYGKLVASGSDDKSIRVWEVATGREVKKLEGHTEWINSVGWSPDGKMVASGSGDESIRVWEVSTGHEVKKLEGHASSVLGVCWSVDGNLIASGSSDNTIRVWNIRSGRDVKRLEGHTGTVWSVCWSPDGKLVASGSVDKSIRVWEIASGYEVKKLEGHTNDVNSVCWSPDGKLVASGSDDKSIRMWEVASGREVQKLEGHTNDVKSVCWSPDGRLVASGSYDNSIRVWEVASGREVKKLQGHTNWVNDVCWSSDGKLVASGSYDKTIRLWDLASWRQVKKIEGHTEWVLSVCWSPDGKLVASGSWDGSIRVWEVASGREVKKLEGHTSWVRSVCWSPDGKLVASGSDDKSIRVWDIASGREVKKLEGHTNNVMSVCWSPDGRLVASGSSDKSIRVWDVASGSELKKFEGHTGTVNSVCWSPDGKLVVSGSADKTIRVWEIFVRRGGKASRNRVFSTQTSCLILGRQPTGMPPFEVYGELDFHSRSDPLVLEFLFPAPCMQDASLPFKPTRGKR